MIFNHGGHLEKQNGREKQGRREEKAVNDHLQYIYACNTSV